MTSFNHYALGSVADWLHTTVAGIAPLEPGFRRILVAPRPGGGLTRASRELETPYGRAAVSWTVRDEVFDLIVDVPTGTSAEVVLPSGHVERVLPGRHRFAEPSAALTAAPAT
jgi:alpha-L-rhamnosidase